MARLDTGWHAHPKILALGLPAMGLHAWSISYCDHALTDGFIPAGAWPALPGVKGAVFALLRAGLWSAVEGGFELHDYTDYNKTKAQVQAYMAAKAESGRAGGQASAQARARQHGQAVAPANGEQTLERNPTPGPGPGPVGSVDLLKNGSTPLAGQPADAQGAPPTRPSLADTEPAVIHAAAGICPFCRKPYLGAYLDHTEAEHAVRSHPSPGNLGPSLGRRRREPPPEAPPPEIEAQFAAMHERLQSIPEVSA